MNATKLCLAFGSFAAMSLPISLHAQAVTVTPQPLPGVTAPVSKSSAAADPNIVKASENLNLVTAEYKDGTITEAQLSEATIALAEAQVRAGVRLNNPVVVQQALATIRAQRQQQLRLNQAEYAAGATDTNNVIKSRLAVAQADVRANLYDIVSLRKQSLSEVQRRNNAGAATAEELTRAQNAYQEAQRLFSESGAGS